MTCGWLSAKVTSRILSPSDVRMGDVVLKLPTGEFYLLGDAYGEYTPSLWQRFLRWLGR